MNTFFMYFELSNMLIGQNQKHKTLWASKCTVFWNASEVFSKLESVIKLKRKIWLEILNEMHNEEADKLAKQALKHT